MASAAFARALMMTPPVGPGAAGAIATTLAIEMPDQRILVGNPTWYYRDYAGVLGVGRRFRSSCPPTNPTKRG